MVIDGFGRRAGSLLTLGRVSAAALALAGCAPTGGTGQGVGGAGLAVPRLSMPIIQWPLGQGTAGAGGATAGTGAAAKGAAPQVVDPFAGQGVAQPGTLKAGRTTKAASSTTTAAGTTPVTPDKSGSASAPQTAASRIHTVATGETAWSVARKYGVSIQDLARANGLPDTMSIRVGQRLTIPPASAGSPVVKVSAPGTGSPTPQPPSASEPLPSEKTRPASAPAPKSDAPDLGKTRTKASGSGKLAMPASGSIARTYKKGTNEGIEISAAPGSAVSAAAGGTVAAVTRDTDGVPIVVVRHDDGLMTVYAGIDKLTVSKGDSVKRGQSIGSARSNGLVHFEVRKGFDSVDPEDYL